MKTVLITGSTGFLGNNLIRRLLRERYHLIALVRNKKGWDKLFRETLTSSSESSKGIEDVELVQGDITHPLLGLTSRRFRRLAWQVDTIFHCAALTDFAHRGNLFHTNVEGTRHVLHFALLGKKKHFHHISSAYVAGKSKGTFYEEDFNKNQRFNNSYEESKFNSEVLVRRFAKEHLLPFTIYRPSIIVGNSRTGHTQCYKGFYAFVRALYLIRERTLKRYNRPYAEIAGVKIPMRIFGDPEALINLVPVDYVAGAINELSKRPEAQGMTFHLTNPHSLTLAQLTDRVCMALRIEGVRPWFPGDSVSGVPTAYDSQFSLNERFYIYYTKLYLPYLQSRLLFDTSNTKKILNDNVTCPKITQSLVFRLIDRAIENQWVASTSGELAAGEITDVIRVPRLLATPSEIV